MFFYRVEAAPPQQYNSSLSNSMNIHTMSNYTPNSYSQLFLPAKTVPIVSTAPSDVSLAPSAISLAPSTVSLPQSLASQMNTTEMLVKPMKKKKRGIMKSISGMFSMGKKNKHKIVDTITPLRAEQCAWNLAIYPYKYLDMQKNESGRFQTIFWRKYLKKSELSTLLAHNDVLILYENLILKMLYHVFHLLKYVFTVYTSMWGIF